MQIYIDRLWSMYVLCKLCILNLSVHNKIAKFMRQVKISQKEGAKYHKKGAENLQKSGVLQPIYQTPCLSQDFKLKKRHL